MIVVFDMDNTLADELGKQARPGAVALLDRLKADGGFELALWTSSTRERARIILAEHGLDGYFGTFIYREDYDPANLGAFKDIRDIGGVYLIDDDPKQIDFVKSVGLGGFLITAYRGGDDPAPGEWEDLWKALKWARLKHRLFGWLR